MAKVISIIKAVLTRIIFSIHSLIAIWQVTQNTNKTIYWTLCGPIGLLVLEGIFTLAIKKNQEWRWFCPSVFIYLSSVVPAIWLLELDKVEKLINNSTVHSNSTEEAGKSILNLNFTALNPALKRYNDIIPKINEKTWITLIEQFLMLILIIGRWLLPKGDLTRDQLSQLLLVYIGTAADIIEFFDSFADQSIARIPILVYLTLGIWSWSLLQFTIVLSATRSRRPRGGGHSTQDESADCCNNCCCGIDVWGIVLNVILQDAPFLTFRLIIIIDYNIINYMNVFFTCKNTLVILLQFYRLYVVNSEHWKARRQNHRKPPPKKIKKKYDDYYDDKNKDIYIISGKYDKRKTRRNLDDSDEETGRRGKSHKEKYSKHKRRTRKDTGYSTASSQNTCNIKTKDEKLKHHKKDRKGKIVSSSKKYDISESENENELKKHNKKCGKPEEKRKPSRKEKHFDIVEEESDTTEEYSSEIVNEKKSKKMKRSKARKSSTSSSSSSSSTSSSSSSSE